MVQYAYSFLRRQKGFFLVAYSLFLIPGGEAEIVGVVAALLLVPLVRAAPDVGVRPRRCGHAVDVVARRQLRRLIS